jgi:hypothetical protein
LSFNYYILKIKSSQNITINGEAILADTVSYVKGTIADNNISLILTSVINSTDLYIYELIGVDKQTTSSTRKLFINESADSQSLSIPNPDALFLGEIPLKFIKYNITEAATGPMQNFYSAFSSSPFIYNLHYLEEGHTVDIYDSANINKVNNRVFTINHMEYSGVEGSILIGSAIEEGITLNQSFLDDYNIDAVFKDDEIIVSEEKFSSIRNCIDVEKFKLNQDSINAITNVQLLTAQDKIVYEFEFPPIIYNEKTQHISFNLLIRKNEPLI